MPAATYVLEYHLVNYRRTWRSSALSTLVLPLLTMLGSAWCGQLCHRRRRRRVLPSTGWCPV
jgi:hypothetical protein